LFYDAAVTPSSSSEYNSSFGSPVASSTPSGCCQTSTHETDYRYPVSEQSNPAKSTQNCSTTTGLTGLCEFPEAVLGSYNSAAFQSDRCDTYPNTALSQVQTQKENPAKQLLYWSPLQDSQTPKEQVLFSLVLSQSPAANQPWTPAVGRSPTSPSAASQPPVTPQTPRSRTDLAFSMSLSPSSSVKTHSFPQGQAFVRKDTEGRWNFTWVPRQEP